MLENIKVSYKTIQKKLKNIMLYNYNNYNSNNFNYIFICKTNNKRHNILRTNNIKSIKKSFFISNNKYLCEFNPSLNIKKIKIIFRMKFRILYVKLFRFINHVRYLFNTI